MSNDFCGHPVSSLSNGVLRIEYLTDVGPRLARLYYKDSPNLFAELPASGMDGPHGRFEFMGGHRLWRSPESLDLTYIPDQPVIVKDANGTLTLSAAVEPADAIVKSMSVRLHPGEASLTIEHEMQNQSERTLTFAPWALSMLRLGGTAILPQPGVDGQRNSFLPNRKVILWPYTRINDPRLRLADDFVLVHGRPAAPALKIGYLNNHGWAAYWLEGVLLVKRFIVDLKVDYPDDGSNVEVYCNDQFLELETLGPLRRVKPAETVRLQEQWEFHTDLPADLIPAALALQITRQ